MAEPVVIGVAGGTGSGKTTVAREILKRAGTHRIALIEHDAYYKDLSDLPLAQRAMRNFDHPDALDNELLLAHLRELKAGRPVEIPVYDFTTHTRTGESRHVAPSRIILLEGILIFADEALRRMMDVKIFVDTDADIRFIRRLERDIADGPPDAPGICRAEQALCGRDHPGRRLQRDCHRHGGQPAARSHQRRARPVRKVRQ